MKWRNVAVPRDPIRREGQGLVPDPERPLLFCVMGNAALQVAQSDRRSSISRRITRGCQPGGVRRESRRPARATATQLISAGSAMTAMEFAVHGDQPPPGRRLRGWLPHSAPPGLPRKSSAGFIFCYPPPADPCSDGALRRELRFPPFAPTNCPLNGLEPTGIAKGVKTNGQG